MKELEFIANWQRRVRPHPQIELGIGDDCGVLRLENEAGRMLVTSDIIMEGVDFLLGEVTAFQVGRKALAVNLSDIAAMAGRPVAAVVGLMLPRKSKLVSVDGIMAGIEACANFYQVGIIGGDTNSWDGALAVSITMLGEPHPRGSVLRSGAKPGDAICVTGCLGGTIHGKHLSFSPRLEAARTLRDHFNLTSMIDLSDGLATDLRHILRSSGVGAELFQESIPLASVLGDEPKSEQIQAAISGGEDFELCFTLPDAELKSLLSFMELAPLQISHIGTITTEKDFLWRFSNSSTSSITTMGYSHDF